ncbi:uncharacterized protein JCM15063_000169 [Sporobolomyces koalae]|uniref:uncharacterized protein n=1 Tax=Sporobolomyces koalae TaxID=500713 RepID=UPI003180DF70
MVALFNTSFPFEYPWPAQVYSVLNKYPNPRAPHVVSVDTVDRQILPDGTIRSERILGISQDSPKWISRILGTPEVTYAREVSFIVPSSLPNPSDPSPTPTATLKEPPKLLMASTNLSLSSLLQCRESISYLPHPWPHLPQPTREQLAPTLSLRDEDDSESSDAELASADTSNPSYPKPSPGDHPLSHPTMPPTTLFSQSALIFTLGPIASNAYPPHGISPTSPIRPESFPAASFFPQRAAGKRVEEYSKGRFEENAQGGRQAMMWAAEEMWSRLRNEAPAASGRS